MYEDEEDEDYQKNIFSSGSSEIDSNIGGGIPLNSLSLIEGDNDTGKSVFVQQMLCGGLNQGKKIVFFTTENTIRSMLNQVDSLGLDISDYFIIGNAKIFPIYTRNVNWNGEMVKNMLHLMLKFMKKRENDVIIIDSFTIFVINSTENDILNFFTGCKKLCDSGKTIMITAHGYAFSKNLIVRIRSICDVHLHLKVNKTGEALTNTIEVAKIRGAKKVTGKIVSFTVEPGFGIKIVTISRARA